MQMKRETQIERTITENADKDSLWAVAYAMLRLASAIRKNTATGRSRSARLADDPASDLEQGVTTP